MASRSATAQIARDIHQGPEERTRGGLEAWLEQIRYFARVCYTVAKMGISYIQVQERQLENFAPVVARLSGK